jgi:hypothetical protein
MKANKIKGAKKEQIQDIDKNKSKVHKRSESEAKKMDPRKTNSLNAENQNEELSQNTEADFNRQNLDLDQDIRNDIFKTDINPHVPKRQPIGKPKDSSD